MEQNNELTAIETIMTRTSIRSFTDQAVANENILLAAHALGLGAVWTGCYPIEKRMATVSEVLGLPETIVPLCVIVMGYPNESPQPKDKWKPENVIYNMFKQ